MGERDNHIATSRALSPGGDYSHMAMVMRSLMVVLMERCSPEGTAAGGGPWGSGPWPPLLPWCWCSNGAGPPLQGGGLGGGKFMALVT